MGERAKVILNEFSAKSMLMRDTVDLNKFYTADLKLMIEVAKQEIKKLQEEKDKEIERLNNQIKEYGDLDNHNKSLYEENKRLNNIINELEKELKDRIKNVPDTMAEVDEDESILYTLQELKGSNKYV